MDDNTEVRPLTAFERSFSPPFPERNEIWTWKEKKLNFPKPTTFHLPIKNDIKMMPAWIHESPIIPSDQKAKHEKSAKEEDVIYWKHLQGYPLQFLIEKVFEKTNFNPFISHLICEYSTNSSSEKTCFRLATRTNGEFDPIFITETDIKNRLDVIFSEESLISGSGISGLHYSTYPDAVRNLNLNLNPEEIIITCVPERKKSSRSPKEKGDKRELKILMLCHNQRIDSSHPPGVHLSDSASFISNQTEVAALGTTGICYKTCLLEKDFIHSLLNARPLGWLFLPDFVRNTLTQIGEPNYYSFYPDTDNDTDTREDIFLPPKFAIRDQMRLPFSSLNILKALFPELTLFECEFSSTWKEYQKMDWKIDFHSSGYLLGKRKIDRHMSLSNYIYQQHKKGEQDKPKRI